TTHGLVVIEVADWNLNDFVAFISQQLTNLPVALCSLWIAVQATAHAIQVKAHTFLAPVRNLEENVGVGLGVRTTEVNFPVHHWRDETSTQEHVPEHLLFLVTGATGWLRASRCLFRWNVVAELQCIAPVLEAP